MSSLLANIEETLSNKTINQEMHNWYQLATSCISGVTLKKTRQGEWYLLINDCRVGIKIERVPKSWNNTIPDWLVFRSKPNAYAKKYGYKTYVKIKTNQFSKDLTFEDGRKLKEYDNVSLFFNCTYEYDLELMWYDVPF